MKCLRYFVEGYRQIAVISKEDDESYDNVKQELDNAKAWKTLEQQTRRKVIEIKDYFEKFLENANEDEEEAEAVVKKAREFGEVMDEYRKKIYKIDAVISVDPEKIDARISLLKERVNRIEVHGLRLGIICTALLAALGAFTAWHIYGAEAVNIVLGGATGLACGILIFLIIYHSILALNRRHLSKWEELKKGLDNCPDMVADIEKKRPITREIASLLDSDVVDKDTLKYTSEGVLTQCKKFLAD